MELRRNVFSRVDGKNHDEQVRYQSGQGLHGVDLDAMVYAVHLRRLQ